MKPVNLSVHKNNREQRARKHRRDDMLQSAKRAARDIGEIDGYVVGAWDKDGTAIAKWDTQRVPGSLVGEMAKRVVERTITNMDVDDRFGD